MTTSIDSRQSSVAPYTRGCGPVPGGVSTGACSINAGPVVVGGSQSPSQQPRRRMGRGSSPSIQQVQFTILSRGRGSGKERQSLPFPALPSSEAAPVPTLQFPASALWLLLALQYADKRNNKVLKESNASKEEVPKKYGMKFRYRLIDIDIDLSVALHSRHFV